MIFDNKIIIRYHSLFIFNLLKTKYLIGVFHWSRPVGNFTFLESRDQCLHGQLGWGVVSRPVGESR